MLASQLGYRPPGSVLQLNLTWNDLTAFHNDSEFAVLASSDFSARPARVVWWLIRRVVPAEDSGLTAAVGVPTGAR